MSNLERISLECMGRAAPETGRILDAATRRGGSTARSRNNVGGRFPGLPEGFERKGPHCGVAPLAQGLTLRGAARLALQPFSLERDPYIRGKSALIHDLDRSKELDREAMASLRGGNSWLKGLGPVANVNVDVNQNIAQLQNIEVNALNNVGVIGAGFGPLTFDINPAQWAYNTAAN